MAKSEPTEPILKTAARLAVAVSLVAGVLPSLLRAAIATAWHVTATPVRGDLA